MSVNLSASASLTIKGITPVAGAGLTLLANPSFQLTNVTKGDYFADTFTVNPLTTTTTLNLEDIVTGAIVWVQTDQSISMTLTQNAVDNTFTVDNFILLQTGFTALKFANPSATTAAHISVVVCGDRVVNPGTPGIY